MTVVLKAICASAILAIMVACGDAESGQGESQSPPVASSLPDGEDHSNHLTDPVVAAADPAPAAPASPPSATAPAAEPASEPEPEPETDPRALTPGDGTIYAGVYTEAQAARGQAIQEVECVACHTPRDWAGGRLLTSFTGQSVSGLVEHIRSTMPLDGPGRLDYEQYVDIAARILQLNEIPAGSNELPADGNALSEIRIEFRR
jgi:mono/diheme cytochrome c family protein